MQRRTVERIEGWQSRPFAGGDDGLRDLASAGGCGAVHAGAWLFVYGGRSVGVFDGTIEDIRSTNGTFYISPEPVLPLLFAMLERDPTQRGEYHTDQMTIEDAVSALSKRDFTGYIELSTGDEECYVVCADGTEHIAFVGTENQLLTGSQAALVMSTVSGSYTVTAVDPADDVLESTVPSQLQPQNSDLYDQWGSVRPDERTPSASGWDDRAGDTSPRLVTDGSNESIEHLRSRIAALERERDSLQTERDDLASENERLETEIEALKDRLSESGAPAADEERLEQLPEETLSGTSLFVRYHDQSRETLEDAYNGDAHPDDVNDNLILEHHATFNDENVVVDGVPYEEFLTNSLEYAVVSWIVRDLPYDIYDAAYDEELAEIYNYIPDIDRAGLRTNSTTDDGTQISFDVVCFDQRGDPLFVVKLHDSREPTTAHEAEELLDNASAAADQWPLTAAFLVTTSYFDATALDTAADATSGGGGLFSSSSRASYVRLSRKHGFHLCLVEARHRQFHVAVPNL